MINLIFYVDDETKKYIDDKIQKVNDEKLNSYRLIYKNIKTIREELSTIRKKMRHLELTKKK